MLVIILMGPSGAGKSTWARARIRKLKEANLTGEIVSADDFFVGADGVYEFSPFNLPEAHSYSLRRFIHLVQRKGLDEVIVDNTNTTLVEVAPYLAVPNAFKCVSTIRYFKPSLEEAVSRTVHGVPKHTIARQLQNLEESLSTWPRYWEEPNKATAKVPQ